MRAKDEREPLIPGLCVEKTMSITALAVKQKFRLATSIDSLIVPKSPLVIAAIAAALAALASKRFLSGAYFPVLDAGWSYKFFAYVLDQLRGSGEAPHWIPEVPYGISAEYRWLTAIGPSQYFILLIGMFTRVSALSLFVVSIAFDQFFFFLGVVLVSRRLFGHAPLVFFYSVASCAILLVIDNGIFWNFRLFQYFPLAFFFLLLAVENCKLVFVTIAGLLFVICAFGGVAYMLPFQIYTLSILFISLVATEPGIRKKAAAFLRSGLDPSNVLALTIAAILFAALLVAARDVQALGYMLGREKDLHATLSSYLTAGGNNDSFKLTELVTAQPVSDYRDFTSYFGAVGFVLLIYGALVERSPTFKSLFIAFCWILAFSVAGSGVARLAYNLPGMDYFRYVGFVIGSAKWIAILCAGFGLGQLLKEPPRSLRLLIAANIVFAGFLLSELWYFAGILGNQEWVAHFHIIVVVTLSLLLSGVLLWLVFGKPQVGLLMLILALGELVCYRTMLDFRYPSDPANRIVFANAAKETYQPQRIWPWESAIVTRFRAITDTPIYDFDAAFTSVDLCGSNVEALLDTNVLAMPAVLDLFKT